MHVNTIEHHPLDPFYPLHTQILMVGSFPPKRERWSMDFYYPNMQNDMWRIFGIIFFNDKDFFLEKNKKRFDRSSITTFLQNKGIALSDTARAVVRLKDNASDKFLKVVTPIDLPSVLRLLPECKAIISTGQKATDILISQIQAPEPKVGSYSTFGFDGREIKLYRMPSSSRAYPKPLPEKAAVYKTMFFQLGLLTK